MKSLKYAGSSEVASLRSRALRLAAMDRISLDDAQKVVAVCNDLQILIRDIPERTEDSDG